MKKEIKPYKQKVICANCGTAREIFRQAKTKPTANFWCSECLKYVKQR